MQTAENRPASRELKTFVMVQTRALASAMVEDGRLSRPEFERAMQRKAAQVGGQTQTGLASQALLDLPAAAFHAC